MDRKNLYVIGAALTVIVLVGAIVFFANRPNPNSSSASYGYTQGGGDSTGGSGGSVKPFTKPLPCSFWQKVTRRCK